LGHTTGNIDGIVQGIRAATNLYNLDIRFRPSQEFHAQLISAIASAVSDRSLKELLCDAMLLPDSDDETADEIALKLKGLRRLCVYGRLASEDGLTNAANFGVKVARQSQTLEQVCFTGGFDNGSDAHFAELNLLLGRNQIRKIEEIEETQYDENSLDDLLSGVLQRVLTVPGIQAPDYLVGSSHDTLILSLTFEEMLKGSAVVMANMFAGTATGSSTSGRGDRTTVAETTDGDYNV